MCFHLVRRAGSKRRQDLPFRKTVHHSLNGMFGRKNRKGATVEAEFKAAERDYLRKGSAYQVENFGFCSGPMRSQEVTD